MKGFQEFLSMKRGRCKMRIECKIVSVIDFYLEHLFIDEKYII